MKSKIINGVILAFSGLLIFCTFYTTEFKAKLMPTVTVAYPHPQRIKSDHVVTPYQNVLPLSCLSKENSKFYLFVLRQDNSVLGSILYVNKVQVVAEASDDKNCAIKEFNPAQMSENMVGFVKTSTSKLHDHEEVKEK